MKILSVGWETRASMAGGLGVHYSELTSRLSGMLSLTHLLPSAFNAVDPSSSNSPPPYSLRSILQYNTHLASLPPVSCDLVHAHDWLTALGSARLARRSGVPLVLSVHSTVLDREFFPSPKIYQIERLAFRSASHLIAVSSMLKETLTSKYGIPEDRISVIPNGLSLPNTKPVSSHPDRPLVLFSGRLVPQKSPETLIYAIPKLLSSFPDARFVFCGTGYLRPCLEAFARTLAIEKSVSFEGFVPHHQMLSQYPRASAFVSSSFSEPFGLSILEALGAGLPSIVTPRTGLLEFCSSPLIAERTSRSIADALSSVLASPSFARRLSRAGRKEAHSLSWDDTALQTLRVYGSVLEHQQSIYTKTSIPLSEVFL